MLSVAFAVGALSFAPPASAAGSNLAGDGGFPNAEYVNWYTGRASQPPDPATPLPTSEPFSATPYTIENIGPVLNYGDQPEYSGNSTLVGGLFDAIDGVNPETGVEYVLQENDLTRPIVGELTEPLVAGAEYEYAFDLGARTNTPSDRNYYVLLFNATTGLPEEFLSVAPMNTLPSPTSSPSYRPFSGTFTADASASYSLLFYVPDGLANDDISIDRVAVAPMEVPQNPSIDLEKSATVNDVDGDGVAGEVGETISYAFTVTNTGNVPLSNVVIDDPLVAVDGGPIASLAPGAVDETTFTATYTITQADVDADQVVNQATATGTDPSSRDVTDVSNDPATPDANDPTVVTVPPTPPIAPDPGPGPNPGSLPETGTGPPTLVFALGIALLLAAALLFTVRVSARQGGRRRTA